MLWWMVPGSWRGIDHRRGDTIAFDGESGQSRKLMAIRAATAVPMGERNGRLAIAVGSMAPHPRALAGDTVVLTICGTPRRGRSLSTVVEQHQPIQHRRPAGPTSRYSIVMWASSWHSNGDVVPKGRLVIGQAGDFADAGPRTADIRRARANDMRAGVPGPSRRRRMPPAFASASRCCSSRECSASAHRLGLTCGVERGHIVLNRIEIV